MTRNTRQRLFFCVQLFAVLFLLMASLGAFAQQTAVVPRIVKFSGTLSMDGKASTTAIFALYKEQTGGAVLWQEAQSITMDSAGHYTVYLGAASQQGIPAELFANAEARWLGITAQGKPEQPRVLLVSVPYAIKAADAETLGGLPASAFLRADGSNAQPAFVNGKAVQKAAAGLSPMLLYSGYDAFTLPVFDEYGNLANSQISEPLGEIFLTLPPPDNGGAFEPGHPLQGHHLRIV